MKLHIRVAALLCLLSSSAMAQEIDLSFSNDTALMTFTTPLSYSGYGRTDGEFGLLYTESDDYMILAGIEMLGEAGSHAPGVHGGVSIRAYAASLTNNIEVGAVTLGGKVIYVPQAMARVSMEAQLNFGPDVGTFGDAERFWDFNGRISYEVLPDAAIYIGYRYVRARLEGGVGNVDLDKGGHVGVKISF